MNTHIAKIGPDVHHIRHLYLLILVGGQGQKMLLKFLKSIVIILTLVGGRSVNADEAALNSGVEEVAWKRSPYRDCYELPPWAFGRFFKHADSQPLHLRSAIRSVKLTVVEDRFDEVFERLVRTSI